MAENNGRPTVQWTSRKWRDIILFIVGVSGIIYETVATGGERPTLIIAVLGMCGAPIFLRTDEAQTAKDFQAQQAQQAQAHKDDPEAPHVD